MSLIEEAQALIARAQREHRRPRYRYGMRWTGSSKHTKRRRTPKERRIERLMARACRLSAEFGREQSGSVA